MFDRHTCFCNVYEILSHIHKYFNLEAMLLLEHLWSLKYFLFDSHIVVGFFFFFWKCLLPRKSVCMTLHDQGMYTSILHHAQEYRVITWIELLLCLCLVSNYYMYKYFYFSCFLGSDLPISCSQCHLMLDFTLFCFSDTFIIVFS